MVAFILLLIIGQSLCKVSLSIITLFPPSGLLDDRGKTETEPLLSIHSSFSEVHHAQIIVEKRVMPSVLLASWDIVMDPHMRVINKKFRPDQIRCSTIINGYYGFHLSTTV